MTPPTFRPFQSGDEAAFRDLNEAWIAQFFSLEAKDRDVLSDPATHILNPGGEIVMVILHDHAIGCCALLPMPDGQSFELGKMAIAETHRGNGIGKLLLAHVIERARQMGVKRLYLETSTKLPNAIRLYESHGFTHLPPDRVRKSPYARSNVYMELPISARK